MYCFSKNPNLEKDFFCCGREGLEEVIFFTKNLNLKKIFFFFGGGGGGGEGDRGGAGEAGVSNLFY